MKIRKNARRKEIRKKKLAERKKALKEAKGKKCLKCGKCCQAICLPTHNITQDMRNYLSYHEHCELITYEGKKYIYIKARCRNLGKDNLCKIYDTRPKACSEAYVSKRENVLWHEGCGLK